MYGLYSAYVRYWLLSNVCLFACFVLLLLVADVLVGVPLEELSLEEALPAVAVFCVVVSLWLLLIYISFFYLFIYSCM